MEEDCRMIENAQDRNSEVSCIIDSLVPTCLAAQQQFSNAQIVNIDDTSLVNITPDSVQIIGYSNKRNDNAIEEKKEYEPINGCLYNRNNKTIEDGKQLEQRVRQKIVRDSGYHGASTFRGENGDTKRNIFEELQEIDGLHDDASRGGADERVKNMDGKKKVTIDLHNKDEFCQEPVIENVELSETENQEELCVGDLNKCEFRDDETLCTAKEETVGNITADFDRESPCQNSENSSADDSKDVKYRRKGRRECEVNSEFSYVSDAVNDGFKQLFGDEVVERTEEVIETNEENQETRVGRCRQHMIHSFVEGKNGNTIIINIGHAGLYIAGNNNKIHLPGGGPYVEPNGSLRLVLNRDDVLQSVIKNDPRLFPKALKRDGSCATRRYDKIMNQMRHFQDNGLSEKMEVYSKKLEERFESAREVDLKVVVKVQFVVFCIYKKDLTRAKTELDEAMKLAEHAENRQFLIGRCLIFYANIALYEKQYEKALNYLDQANSVLALFASGEDKAMIWYLYGCVYMNMAALKSEISEELERKAIECFEIEVQHGKEDPDPCVIAKKLQFSMLKRIHIYLRTYASHCHEYQVSKASTAKAKELLDAFEHDLWSEASSAAQVHFAAMRSDYFYRMGQPLRALDIIKTEGAIRARRIGHLPLKEMVDSRISLFEELIMGNERNVMVLEDVSDEAIDNILDEED
eukprot:Seg1529.7 transcript_id=Seg1529.7/GoldUCD/mRNA.D3Y31 product="hypothetical protein" protein_id=Seg1529.7/GoldUCD/D3Y31